VGGGGFRGALVDVAVGAGADFGDFGVGRDGGGGGCEVGVLERVEGGRGEGVEEAGGGVLGEVGCGGWKGGRVEGEGEFRFLFGRRR